MLKRKDACPLFERANTRSGAASSSFADGTKRAGLVTTSEAAIV